MIYFIESFDTEVVWFKQEVKYIKFIELQFYIITAVFVGNHLSMEVRARYLKMYKDTSDALPTLSEFSVFVWLLTPGPQL